MSDQGEKIVQRYTPLIAEVVKKSRFDGLSGVYYSDRWDRLHISFQYGGKVHHCEVCSFKNLRFEDDVMAEVVKGIGTESERVFGSFENFRIYENGYVKRYPAKTIA